MRRDCFERRSGDGDGTDEAAFEDWKMSSINVSAIILDYFGAEKTERCLASLIGQGIKTVYLLDNSDSSSASQSLGRTVDRIRTRGVDYALEILSMGKNLGFAGGVNFVLAHDRCSKDPHDYYLLLNNDAIAGSSLVAGLLAKLQAEPEAVLVAPRIIATAGLGEYGIWYHRYLGLLLSHPRKFCFHYLTGCCLLFKRDLVRHNGLFDEAFFMYGEDAELGWRLASEGRQLICAPDVFVRHEAGAASRKGRLFYEYHTVRSHILLALRTWVHPVEIPFIVSAKFFTLASRAIIRCFRYRTFVPLAAFFLAWFPLKDGKVLMPLRDDG
jgi:hypothetical protein